MEYSRDMFGHDDRQRVSRVRAGQNMGRLGLCVTPVIIELSLTRSENSPGACSAPFVSMDARAVCALEKTSGDQNPRNI